MIAITHIHTTQSNNYNLHYLFALILVDCMTSSYAALKPFPLPPTAPLTLELATLNVEPEQPYAAYIHHLYVRPLYLIFESQKMFARARNIACSIELRENDTGDNKPLQVR